MAEYASDLRKAGRRVVMSASGSYWMRGEVGSLMRIPTFDTSHPAPGEVQRVLFEGHAAIASYLVEPDPEHPANAFLYVCRDNSYSLGKLPRPARKSASKANKYLQYSWADRATILERGYPAYRDSKMRNGLSDSSIDLFRIRYNRWFDNAANHAMGAWKDGELIGFAPTTIVDDWAEFGTYSMDSALTYCPNNGLVNHLFNHLLAERGFRIVGCGLSSVQEDSRAAGLHHFKLSVGYKAIPVRRVFVVHPLLRPLANRLTLAACHSLLKVAPSNRVLKKASGVLSHLADFETEGDIRNAFPDDGPEPRVS
jgi:hypothetical protein